LYFSFKLFHFFMACLAVIARPDLFTKTPDKATKKRTTYTPLLILLLIKTITYL